MPTLKERLRADLATAMKARDETTVATLRLALTAVTNDEVAGSAARELSDDQVQAVLVRESRKYAESFEAFHSAGRAEQAAEEQARAAVLARYLPAPLDDVELDELVEAAVQATGADSPRAIGPR
ncbi:MAG: GatB/YqeY domain-containing protein, partial [Actinomycetes bacterium]